MSADNFLKKIPLKSLAKLIESHYAALTLIEAALRDLPELPPQTYRDAHGLFATQLNALVKQYERRTNQMRTQRVVDAAIKACLPQPPAAASIEATSK